MGAPALLDGQAGGVLERLNDVTEWVQTHVDGALITDGGTTQGSGAATALNFDADTSIATGAVKGVPITLAAGTDIDSDAGIAFGATSGKAVIYTVIAHTGATGLSAAALIAYPSAVANTGEGVALTKAEIAALLTHSNFAIVGDITVVRTADTAVTFAVDYTRRFPRRFPSQLAETEAAYRATT